jgi:anthranilate synthase/aminodeoxychorismate synthase-like glutamine amidotransferase
MRTGRLGVGVRVLVIDNYDSFAYNLVQYIGELGAEVDVVRNDHAQVDELLERGYERCVVSPGPCTPNEAGISIEATRRLPEAGVPLLGVCLGHQSLAQAFGGRVALHEPVHGKSTTIEHDGRTIFAGLSTPLEVGRYHSLVVEEPLPDCLEASAHGGGVLMAMRHRELPAEGVQFHPESVLTAQGKHLLANFLGTRRPAPSGVIGRPSAQHTTLGGRDLGGREPQSLPGLPSVPRDADR